jgi:predicted ATPase
MITEYQIENFKAFGSPQTLPIRPITLIFGPNSSGKSSIFQSMLMMKQTIEKADNPETTLLFKGDLVDLGSFRESVHHHDLGKSFSFTIKMPRPTELYQLIDIPVVLTDNLREEYVLLESIINFFDLLGVVINFYYDHNTSDTSVSEISIFLGEEVEPLIIYKPYNEVYYSKIMSPRRHKIIPYKSEKIYLYTNIINYFHQYFEVKKDMIEYLIQLLTINNSMTSEEKSNYKSKLLKNDEIGEWLKIYIWNFGRFSDDYFYDLKRLASEYDHKLLFNKTEPLTPYILELLMEFHAKPPESQEKFNFWLTEKDSPLKDFLIMFHDMNKEKRENYIKELIDEIRPDTLTLKNYLPYELNTLPIQEIISQYSGYGSEDAGNISLLSLAISTIIKNFLDNLLYLGPQRENPERYYSFSGNQTHYVGKSGKFVPDLLINNKELLGHVNKWFNNLDIEYELKISSLDDPDTEIHDLFALRLCDKNGVHVGLTDVGFGLSQVLPVIVQSVASQEKTILIEQPEYHLHPRLQAELGDMFIESALGEQKNTFLIETHSEHLILRILRRIRETSEGTLPEGATPITPDQVSVVYVQPGAEGSQIISLPVTEDGDFDRSWPDGFFSERARELM